MNIILTQINFIMEDYDTIVWELFEKGTEYIELIPHLEQWIEILEDKWVRTTKNLKC